MSNSPHQTMFNLLTPLSVATKSATTGKTYEKHEQSAANADWGYISRVYEEYRAVKNKEIWAYRSVDISAISWFAPYALIHKVNQQTSGQFGRGKTSAADCARFVRNWDYKSVPETFVDVSRTISKTHNFTVDWITRRHDEWIAHLGQKLAAHTKTPNELPPGVIHRLKDYILADSSIILLADKSVDIQTVDKLVYYLLPGEKMNHIGSNNRNLLGKTGLVEFRKPSQMRQQVVQLRNRSVVYMHPWLYENWYSSGISTLGYPSTATLEESVKLGKVDVIGDWINTQPGLRIKSRDENCHHCKQPKGNQFDYYDRLCWDCGLRAWQIRHKHADLRNLRMCVTGCRHTVGWATTLRALRQGAFVLGTTRFPNLALAAYKLEPDYPVWRDRLVIIGADFTKYHDIQTVISALSEYRINCYINNAFQTMPNTPDYLMNARQLEMTPPTNLDELRCVLDCNGNIRPLAITSGSADTCEKRDTGNPSTANTISESKELAVVQHRFGIANSWKQPIHKIAPEEIITAGMVNQIAPGLIISAFRQLAGCAAENKEFPYQVIINVGSSEGNEGVQASITGGHKNHMQKIIECLRAEKDPHLLAYTSDPGFITGVFGKTELADPGFITGVFGKSEPSVGTTGTGLIKVLTADDGGARVIWPLIDFLNTGLRLEPSYRG